MRKWIEKVVNEGWINGNVVVDDCRFLNEANTVKLNGGIIIRVLKIGQVSSDAHGSETEMNNIKSDYLVSADPGGNEMLLSQIDKIMEGMI